ncbi:MAG: Na+/H+ antiporter NhaC family protein [Bacteroidetes bacterium]|jgi:Na+/H+ antiporter NhaC|nr:Na+/H+ antiporter NhaC family protein [Bacteroidota bacterium]
MRFLLALILLGVGQFVALAGEANGVSIPEWTSIIPPIVAIALALILREVLLSLTIGIFSGLILMGLKSSQSIGQAFLEVPTAIQDSLVNKDHISVILFTLMIGAMVSIISKNGGMMALVKRISKKATTARSGQLATWLLGIAIFFDDYANTLVVGNTMRPLTDRLKVSREKLAYIVDSTAAPVAAIAFITTWIGAELGYISDGIAKIPNGINEIGSAYGVFFQSLQYMFYPILTLFFIFLLVWRKRDFGPMLKAERKARAADVEDQQQTVVSEIDEVEDKKESLWSAVLPIGVMIIGATIGLFYTGLSGGGEGQEYVWNKGVSLATNLSEIIGRADSYLSLIWGSFCGLFMAILITISAGILHVRKTMSFAEAGVKSMMPAILILTLAWTLGAITESLGTAEYLAALSQGNIMPAFIPTIVFVLAAGIAFSTGTSWGTMSILYPVVLVTSWNICAAEGLDVAASMNIFANVVSAVLAGSVLGDHCSPISDTTILSSLSADCDHVQHVKTQMPYALTVGGVSIILGTIPAGFGIPFYITFPIAALTLYFIVSYFGKMTETETVSQ